MNAPNDFRAMTADSVGKDLLSALVTELRLLPDVWTKLSEKKQNDIIDRLRARVQSNIAMAVHTLASAGRTVVAGDLDQITIKDGVKAVIKFSAAAPSLHELYDAQARPFWSSWPAQRITRAAWTTFTASRTNVVWISARNTPTRTATG